MAQDSRLRVPQRSETFFKRVRDWESEGVASVAKSKRLLLKRQIAHAYRNICLAMRQLGALEAQFAPMHKKHAEHLRVMIVTLDMMRDGIKGFCNDTWGGYPANWESWRNVGKPDLSDYDVQTD